MDTLTKGNKRKDQQMGHAKKENGLYQRIYVPVGK
jgi:hypothetical protein